MDSKVARRAQGYFNPSAPAPDCLLVQAMRLFSASSALFAMPVIASLLWKKKQAVMGSACVPFTPARSLPARVISFVNRRRTRRDALFTSALDALIINRNGVYTIVARVRAQERERELLFRSTV